ncbi:MAG TPA: class II fructose-bisphosphate aldolase [Steroidobacteraceae bacterium]|nr:class II fructose-bisphosphate aldolase [Steroidobacteraceae bacterium]HUA23703.1 class II fructose-bisphosphate aldolase [Steroidobacteraceae bacterium]
MTTLLEVLQRADARRIALGHFNVSDLVTLYGVVEAAREQELAVVVGASEAERRFIGVQQLVTIVKSLRDQGGPPIFLNADHTHSLSGALEAARAGFDWVVCDFSSLPFDENLRQTKQAVLALKALRPDILVEGEIGDIGSGSQIHDSAPRRPLTTPEEAIQFVQETAIDTLAPAVGNMHGVLKSMLSGDARKHLDIERIRAIKERTRIFMTLHGGSDTADSDLRGAISAGMTVVHINTEVRLAWRRAIEESFAKQKDDIAPYTLLAPAVEAVKRVVGARLALFSADPLR